MAGEEEVRVQSRVRKREMNGPRPCRRRSKRPGFRQRGYAPARPYGAAQVHAGLANASFPRRKREGGKRSGKTMKKEENQG